MDYPEVYDVKPARKAYSRVGWALCAILAAGLASQLLISLALKTFWPDGCWLTTASTGKWLLNFVPLYAIAIPTGMLLLRNVPAAPPQPSKLSAKHFWIFLPICFFLMYCGSFAGQILSSLLSGGDAQNALDEFALDSNPVKILFIAILAPLFEEFVFRKQLIDRTRIYGEKTAAFLSALTFALFHTNLFQFFYAFLVGWIFAYIYLRTGKLRYPAIMHAIINFMGSVVAPWILSLLDLDAMNNLDPNAPMEEIMAVYNQILPGLMLMLLYFGVIVTLFIAGLVLVILQRKKLVWLEAEQQLPAGKGFQTVCLNVGMAVFLLISLALTILSVLL